jgi:undecaprenyl-diphosphatase
MTATGTAETPKLTQSSTRVSVSGFENLSEFGLARSPENLASAGSMRVWIGAGFVGVLVCWWVVADHFAFLRHVDEYISLTVNRLAWRNEVFNHAVYIASEAPVFTGALLVGLVWYYWFHDNAKDARERLLLGFGAALTSGTLSRVLQVSLPVRLRPLHDLDSGFQPLPGINAALFNHWGSFPSDHAALFFALVAVVWQRSRRLGLLALLSALYGTIPRIYLGLHYFSDLSAGAALGVALALVFERFGPRTLARRGIAWEQRLPGLFYGAAFLASFEVATLFEDIRQAARGIPAVLKQFGI